MTETLSASRVSYRDDAEFMVTILGAGRVVTEYYLPALRATGIASQIVVVDQDEASLAAVAEAHPTARCIRHNHASFLAGLNEDIGASRNLLIVALPNQFHVEACTAALGRQLHVLCEKPLSLRADDCSRIADLARANRDVANVAMVRRHLPSWMLARQIVQGGELGRLTSVEVRDCAPFGWRPRSFAFFSPDAGGVLADMGVHYLDFLEWTLGPLWPRTWQDDWKGGTESSCVFGLSAGEVDVSIVLSRIDPAGAVMRFVGARGELTVPKSNENQVLLALKGQPVRSIELRKPFPSGDWPADLRGSFCELLVDQRRVMRGEPNVAATAEDAERTVALIEWAYSRRRSTAKIPVAECKLRHVLVTGGTGFIGGHLVDRLHRDGQDIRCLVRSPATCANLARYPVNLAEGNVLDRDRLRRAMQGIEVVHHLAYGSSGQDSATITIEGTKNVVEAAIGAGVRAVVIASTAYVYGLPERADPVDETCAYAPYGGEYGRSKMLMEQWCLARAANSGKTRIVILNPTNVFGPGGGAYTTLPVQLAKQGIFAWLEGGRGLCNYTYVDNVVDALMAAAEVPAAHGKRYIVTDGVLPWIDFLGPFVTPVGATIADYRLEVFSRRAKAAEAFSVRRLIGAVAAAQGIQDVARRSRVLRHLAAMSFLGTFFHPKLTKTKGPIDLVLQPPAPPFPPAWLAELYHTRRTTFTAESAQKALGWRPRISWDLARDTTLEWLNSAGYFRADA
jgi:nucleoside-diphosphate-sugar epimerase/predicted dehydrogenase